MDWFRSLFCLFLGHKEPYADFLTSKVCPRCYKTVEIINRKRPLSEGTRAALRDLKKRHARWKKRGY